MMHGPKNIKPNQGLKKFPNIWEPS